MLEGVFDLETFDLETFDLATKTTRKIDTFEHSYIAI